MNVESFYWIDDFIKNIKPYVFVRLQDHILIKKPNVAQKLNENGAKILHYLLQGNTIDSLLKKIDYDEEKSNDILNFIIAVKHSLEGKLDFGCTNPAIEKKPFETPFSQLPVLSELAITSHCNLKCSFCYAGINCDTVNSSPNLSTDDLKKLIHAIRYQAQVPSISFTGGEPTLRRDLFELISYAESLEMRVNLISNGTLINEEFAKKLHNAGLDTAQISIEATNAALHDNICGVGGSFEKSIKAIHFLQSQGIRVHGNTTLSHENYDNAIHFPLFYKQLGLERFSMNLVIPVGSAKVHSTINLTYLQVSEIVEKIRIESLSQGIEFMWYSPIPVRLYNTIVKELGNKGCAACDGLLSIDPEGNILPCSSWNEPMGNLLKDSFSSIWHNSRSTHIRKKMESPSQCFNCDSFQVCQGACPLYWKVFNTNEINEYCKIN